MKLIIYTLNLDGPESYGVELASEDFDKIVKYMVNFNFFNRLDDWELEVWENGNCIASVNCYSGIMSADSLYNKDLIDEIYARFVMEKLVWDGSCDGD